MGAGRFARRYASKRFPIFKVHRLVTTVSVLLQRNLGRPLNLPRSHSCAQCRREVMNQSILAVFAALLFSVAGMAQTQSPQQLAWSILQDGVNNTNSQQRVSAVTVLALITADPKAI